MPRWLAHVIVMLVLTAGVALAFMRVDYTWNWLGVWEYRQKFIQGWVTTVGISLTALVCSSFIGIFTAFLHITMTYKFTSLIVHIHEHCFFF